MPHDWQHMDEDHEPTDYWQCRFCGGRKPDESDDYQSPLQERFRHGMHPE